VGTPSNQTTPEPIAGGLVGGRYLVRSLLGRGGMAAIYDVLDSVTGRSCVLKRLIPLTRNNREAAIRTLFEREFLTLSQLQHPNVVGVYDYGVDDGVPYYTMELVTGVDLQARVPLPWLAACRIARDLCGVLALLHSRRLIYRDLNPRNVRITDSGLTKLIDFGAMSLMGLNRELVGTPAFCAPEAFHFQPMDGRTDLYALGVMLYLMLTGRVPFRAKDFAQMRAQWDSQPPPLSQFASDVPSALEQLVLEMMRSKPALRPANAAEVIDRLNAITGASADEHFTIHQAYLLTPTLVGRTDVLDTVRDKIDGALSRRGASIVLSGASGSGRSRLLAACELEAKLLGFIVLRPDSADLGLDEYATARAIILQLLDIVPDTLQLISRQASVLVHVVPELLDRIDGIVPISMAFQNLDQAVQPVLRQVLIDVSRRHALMIAVDDADRIDGASLAFLTLLAQEVASNALVLITALESTRVPPAHVRDSLELLVGSSSMLALEPLSAEAVELLLGSVFGEVPNLHLLSHRLEAIARGNPRDLLQIAQHLVDRGVLRYRNGAWTLPDNLSALDLPSGMAQALRARAQLLSPDGRALAQTMAQSGGQRFAFDECVVLANEARRSRVMQCLDELMAASVVRLEGGLFALAQPGWIAPLSEALSVAGLQACNARLAALFASRNDDIRVAQHLLRAGQTERGIEVLARHAVISRHRTDEDAEAYFDLMRSLPDDWLETYERALQLCSELRRPYAEIYALRSRLCGLLAGTTVNRTRHFEATIADLARDCGLDRYAASDASLPALERLRSALAAAQLDYDRASPADRGEDPASAVRQLARIEAEACGIIALGLNHELALRMPSLEPLAPLSPALRIVDKLVLGIAARVSGRIEQALEVYASLLVQLEQPDRGGLDPAHHIYTVLGIECGTGMLQAAMGLDSCLAYASRLESHPQHQVNAILMRMLHELWQGRHQVAQRLKREAELARIQITQRRTAEGSHLLGELTGYALAGELTGVKQVTEAIERQAQLFAGWGPVLHYARSECHRLCGNAEQALVELGAALSLVQPGHHQIWIWVAAAHVGVLLDLGRDSESIALGKQYLKDALEQGLGYTCNYVRMPLSLGLSQLGEHAQAAEYAQACVDEFAALGATGLNRCLALETRALVAVRSGDRQTLEECIRALSPARSGDESLLVPRYDRVIKEAQKAGLLTRKEEAPREVRDDTAVNSQLVRSTFETCHTIPAMARASLELVVRSTASLGGLFYSVTAEGLVLQAEVDSLADSPEHFCFAREHLAREQQEELATVVAGQTEATVAHTTRSVAMGAKLHAVTLSHRDAGRDTFVAVVILLRPRRLQIPGGLVTELSRVLFGAGLTWTKTSY
jgi:tRNA A-37 threonylcarbamoyl transferase component Bud32